jgi:hypothetical protein
MSPTAILEAPQEIETSTAENEGCLCGVPYCPGHPMIDGRIVIDDHPILGRVIIQSRLRPTGA